MRIATNSAALNATTMTIAIALTRMTLPLLARKLTRSDTTGVSAAEAICDGIH